MLLQRNDELKNEHGLSRDPQFTSLFDEGDRDDDGELDETEFHRLCFESAKTEWDVTHMSKENTRALFWHLDVDDSGKISRRELKSFLTKKQGGWGSQLELDRARVDELK